MTILTADLNVVVAILKVGTPSAVPDAAIAVQVGVSLGAIEPAKRLAELGVRRLAAHGVHPELAGPGVEVDAHGLGRRANLDLDGVEEASLLCLQADVVLAANDPVLGLGALGNANGVSDETRLLDHAVVHREIEETVSRKRQSREGQESGQHDDNQCLMSA